MTWTMPTNADQFDHGHERGHQHHDDQAPELDLSEWEQDERERQPYDADGPVPDERTHLTVDESDLGHGWVAVEAILSDGSTAFWLVDPDQPPGGVWRDDLAPHELDGPLPREYKQLTCGAISPHTGRPCRNPVKASGGYCTRHRGGVA